MENRPTSIITDLFEGQLCMELTCQKCKCQTYGFQSFSHLSLDISSDSLIDSIDSAMTKSFKISLAECEKCKILHDATRTNKIVRNPKIMVLHINRSTQNKTSSLQIPNNLDMSNYQQVQTNANETQYQLYGIINKVYDQNQSHFSS